ncbi:MAG: tetratricopeptide repeat protein, partial [Thermoanaerobaculia bacterium]
MTQPGYMTYRPSAGATSLALLLALAACGQPESPAREASQETPAPPPAPETVPHPDLEGMEPAVRKQLRSARAAVEAARHQGAAALAAATGELGRLYHAYDLAVAAAACYRNAAALDPTEPRWQHLLGHLHHTRGEYAASAAAFERALESGARTDARLLYLAVALRELERFDEAERYLRQALLLGPENAAVHHELGRLAVARGQPAVARDHLLRTLELRPTASVTHYQLGLAYRDLGDPELARWHLDRAGPVGVGISDPEVQSLRGLVVAAGVSLGAGSQRALAGDLEGAVAEYRKAVQADPESAEAHAALGSVLLDLGGADEEAWYHLQRALQLAPEHAVIQAAVGRRFVLNGSLRESLPYFERALALEPDHGDTHLWLGLAQAGLGSHRDAERHLSEALRVDPQNPEAFFHRGASRAELGRADQAMADFQQVAAIQPWRAEAHLRLADLLQRTGDTTAALRAIHTALDLDLSAELRAWALDKRGLILARQGEPAAARASFEEALRSQPDFSQARFNLAVTLTRQGHHNEAADQFGRVVRLQPANSEARVGMSLALIAAGRYQEAEAVLEAGMAQTPDQPQLATELCRLLASCPHRAQRDGHRALALARQLFEADPTVEHVELLAMALAETGRFEEAASWQERALRVAADDGRAGQG